MNYNYYVFFFVVFFIAQKLGLVASPRERLTEDEWTRVKERSVQQEESAQPCAICREEFQLHPQVLPNTVAPLNSLCGSSFFPLFFLLFFFYCILCLASGKPVFPYTQTHTHTHMETQNIPLAPSFSPAVPVCSNLCRQLYKFTHTALELNCDVMM